MYRVAPSSSRTIVDERDEFNGRHRERGQMNKIHPYEDPEKSGHSDKSHRLLQEVVDTRGRGQMQEIRANKETLPAGMLRRLNKLDYTIVQSYRVISPLNC